jgi:hypothetical protein
MNMQVVPMICLSGTIPYHEYLGASMNLHQGLLHENS